MKKQFKKNGIYLFVLKNINEKESIYYDREYEYDVYYFGSKKEYSKSIKNKEKFFVESKKGLLPKEIKNAEYFDINNKKISSDRFENHQPQELSENKFYCVIIETEHVDSLIFDADEYEQKIYEFDSKESKEQFLKGDTNAGKLKEAKKRKLHFKNDKEITYIVKSGNGSKILDRNFILNKKIFNTEKDSWKNIENYITKVILYPSLDTYVFNCHEDCVVEAVSNISYFSETEIDTKKFIEKIKSFTDKPEKFKWQYVGKSLDIDPDDPYYTDDECIHFINTYFKLDFIEKTEEIEAIKAQIYYKKTLDYVGRELQNLGKGTKEDLEIIKSALSDIGKSSESKTKPNVRKRKK